MEIDQPTVIRVAHLPGSPCRIDALATPVVRVYEFRVQEGYQWVAPVNDADFERFLSLDGTPRLEDWTPVRMTLIVEDGDGSPLLPSDLPWLGEHAPVFRDTAAKIFGPVLSGFGELLPLACDDAQLAAFNATTVIDALDIERSSIVRLPSSGRIVKVNSFAFRADLLTGVIAFKVPQLLRYSVFVADEIPAACEAANLRGAGFRLLWDSKASAQPTF